METRKKTYTKSDLVRIISHKTGWKQIESKKAVNAFLCSLEEILRKGESVNFIGFGKFYVNERQARVGYNPQTGKKLDIPAKQVVRFSAGESLQETVNQHLSL